MDNHKDNTLFLHAEKKQFGLKDMNRTALKYADYKPEKVKRFFSEHSEEINEHLEELSFIIENTGSFHLVNTSQNLNGKRDINRLKNVINWEAYRLNSTFIERLEPLNKNEKRTLTILLYLRNYDKINAEMKKAFMSFCEVLNE